ncbi:hypothetical protein E3N88_12608 [Mikania micrantha]|uniref:CCHC-type domain-containing protein n=1 Tax=Mikania micrantha TaxID=192012 RepID=A0A5N6P7B7_9ASTR|nr:hypothetical protein E3N88_12608 [Mikania micrantha]
MAALNKHDTENGSFIPTVPATGAGGAPVPKDPALYSDEDYKRMEVDSKALWLIQMAIPNSIMHAFKKCKSAQELWNSLQQMYEGFEDVKENKKDMLKQKFENFCQQNNEKMTSQYLMYVQLVDELVAAGVKMENQDVIRKFLGSLPHAWNIYSVAIRRTENLRTLKLSELFGILRAYQMEIDAQEPKSSHVTSGSAALYAPINNPSYQSYQPIYHPTSTPIVSFPETPTPTPTHTNPFSNPTPLLTSGQGAFMAEETNYFHLCQEDLDGIPADDLEEMDINYQMAMISYRAKKFYQRTGRQFKKHNMKTGFGLDKSKLKCFNCQQLGHFAREFKSTGTQPSTSGQPPQRPSSSNSANIAEQDFADWSFQAEDPSISNSALMANDSTSSFKVTEDMCTLECLEKLNVFKRINSQLCNELESLQVVKANFFECERNYKEKIEEMEKTISSLKHEDTNKQCQINNLLERLTTAKTELVLAESYRDKFLSQGEKYEKLFRMSSTTELVNKKGAGLGYNKVEPPSAYTPIVEIRCKPVVDLYEDVSPSTLETEKPALKINKVNKKTKKQSSVFVKAKNIQTGSTSSDDYVTCPSDKSKREAECFLRNKEERRIGASHLVLFEEPERNSRKKESEASTSDSRKKQDKKGFGKKGSEESTSENQNRKASEKNVSEDQERNASEGKRTSEAHAKKASYKPKKSFPF